MRRFSKAHQLVNRLILQVAANLVAGPLRWNQVNLQLGRAVDRRIELEGHRRQAPGVGIHARVFHLCGVHVANLRTARLDRHHAGDSLGR